MAFPWAAAGSIIGGIGSLFGGGSKNGPSARENTVKLAQGARQAAERYGFNPLTMLGAGAGMGGGGGGGGAPPLASIQMITDGLAGIDDERSGDAARRRQADQLEIDLAKLKLDQARSGVLTAPSQATDQVGPSLSPLGRNRGTYVASNVRAVAPRITAAGPASFTTPNPVAPGRKKDVAPLTNAPGVFELQNKWTGGKPITIPGEGEPWGLEEVATAAIFGLPQVWYHAEKKAQEDARAAAARGQEKALRDLEEKAARKRARANP